MFELFAILVAGLLVFLSAAVQHANTISTRGLGFVFLRPYFPDNSLRFWILSSGLCLLLGGLHAIGLVQIWSRA